MADQNIPENELDPGANTQMFKAFVSETQPAAEPKFNGRVLAVVGAAVLLVIVVVLIAVL
ncbi:hypothetical protein OG474_26835 [Kribbella sp. NBC_01505]|uniref:hypothetical protein n=1 Tax=Kribbella sp. NBC_01505 TaxID=2903580 RepID=UPI003866F617